MAFTFLLGVGVACLRSTNSSQTPLRGHPFNLSGQEPPQVKHVQASNEPFLGQTCWDQYRSLQARPGREEKGGGGGQGGNLKGGGSQSGSPKAGTGGCGPEREGGAEGGGWVGGCVRGCVRGWEEEREEEGGEGRRVGGPEGEGREGEGWEGERGRKVVRAQIFAFCPSPATIISSLGSSREILVVFLKAGRPGGWWTWWGEKRGLPLRVAVA